MEFALLVGLLASWLLLALVLYVLYQLILQNGRILERLDLVESGLVRSDGDPEVEDYLGTLPVGVPAPPIDLPDLSGVTRSLGEWRGQRVLLVFMDPECAYSRRLLPYLVAIGLEPVPGRPTPVVVTTGDAETNRRLFDEAGFTHAVLVQTDMEVAAAFKVDGTPMSYLVNADGTIASELAAGVQATLILAGETATEGEPQAPASTGQTPGLLRDGLKTGTKAPVFRLPLLAGGEVSLLDYRGKAVVLVFSDPDCGPCDDLAPRLVEAHRRATEASVLMISRGNIEANRAMAARHGLNFPIALQRHWEISGEYGIFAAPAAFYIDEWGVVATGVAVGPEAIIELVDQTTGGLKETSGV